jgi:hypothetical protein
MKYRVFTPALLLLLSSTSLAFSAATAEEAASIKASIQAYVGNEPGVVEVTPDGDDYEVTLDVMPYIKKNATADFTATIDPMKITVSPGDEEGEWDVSSSGPYAFSMASGELFNTTGKIENFDWKGTFDEALGAMSESSSTIKGITISSKVTQPGTPGKTAVEYSIGSVESKSTATEAGEGLADSESTLSFADIKVSSKTELSADAGAGGPSFDYDASIAKGSYVTTMKSANLAGILDLVAWFVAHPKEDLVKQDQAALKEKILAALPVFASLTSSSSFETLKVNTAMGVFAAELGGSSIDLNGVVKDGKFGEGINLSGITIPAGLAPAWATELVPTSMKLDFSVSGFDVEAPVRLAVGAMDLTKDPAIPAEIESQMQPAFTPSNTVIVTMNPGEIVSPVYTLSYDGVLTVNLAGLPTGKATIRLRGIDALMAKLSAAGEDPMAKQGVPMLVAAKGFGKAEADGSIVWVIEGTPTGQVTINGLDMSSMLGTPPVAPAQ